MAKRKPPSGQVLKEGRAKLAKLKKLGLWKGDARKAKLGWRQKQTIKEFADVLAGRAKVVKVPRKNIRDIPKHGLGMGNQVRRKGNVVIAPVRSKDERLRFEPKTKRITSHVKLYGKDYKRVVFGERFKSVSDLPSAPKGKRYSYGLIAKNGSMRFEDKEELKNFLAEYNKDEQAILRYIEVLESTSKEDDEDED